MAAMKLFRRVQMYFRVFGFHAPSSANQNCKLSRKNWCVLFVYVGMFVSVSGYLIFKASTVYEYGISFLTSITLIHILADFVIIIWEIANISKIIEKYEDFITKRKLT